MNVVVVAFFITYSLDESSQPARADAIITANAAASSFFTIIIPSFNYIEQKAEIGANARYSSFPGFVLVSRSAASRGNHLKSEVA